MRKGMGGGYAYKRIQVVGDERYHDKPNKNRFSHPCDAAQYMMLGAGEGYTLLSPTKQREDPYSRRRRHGNAGLVWAG